MPVCEPVDRSVPAIWSSPPHSTLRAAARSRHRQSRCSADRAYSGFLRQARPCRPPISKATFVDTTAAALAVRRAPYRLCVAAREPPANGRASPTADDPRPSDRDRGAHGPELYVIGIAHPRVNSARTLLWIASVALTSCHARSLTIESDRVRTLAHSVAECRGRAAPTSAWRVPRRRGAMMAIASRSTVVARRR